jgi:hypoxanthine-DNA glycosylase
MPIGDVDTRPAEGSRPRRVVVETGSSSPPPVDVAADEGGDHASAKGAGVPLLRCLPMATSVRVQSFSPVVAPTSRVLVLGSMPGTASLTARAYYAHPRNAFWTITAAVTGVDATAPYEDRVRGLVDAGVALWDVAHTCVRTGSLDAAIDDDSVEPNDVAGLLRAHPSIRRVCLNGGKAHALFRKHVAEDVVDLGLDLRLLPSTSPAHAGLSLADKRARWLLALAP